MDLDFLNMDGEMVVPIILAIVGAGMAWFTIGGGFFGDTMPMNFFYKLFITLSAGVIGYAWGYWLKANG